MCNVYVKQSLKELNPLRINNLLFSSAFISLISVHCFLQMTADKAGLSKPRGNSSSNSSSYVSDSSKITTLPLSEKRRGRGREVEYKAEEQAFLVSLYKYMKERKTPIERIPYLGFKQSKISFYSISQLLIETC